MALLDVTELLSDPDFCDTITVFRDVETVGANGRATMTPETFSNITAVVTAGQGDILKQFPEMTNVDGSIMVHTTFALRSESDGSKADRIVWRGRQYRVTGLNDWLNFGAGFVVAIASLINLQEADV